MGGQLFTGTSRIPNAVMAKIRNDIDTFFMGRAVIPPKLGDKVDHGDLDIYYDGSDPMIAANLIKYLNSEDRRVVEYATDGKILVEGIERYTRTKTVPDEYGWDQTISVFEPPSNLSMKVFYSDYEGQQKAMQVDLVRLDPGKMLFGAAYFSYNDACMLVGMIAHRLGLKFGHDGLWYVLRDGDHELGQFCLTDMPLKALRFLGFDADKFAQGFDTREEMFQWVIDSTFFHPDAFDPDNRNHRQRSRDAKREVYGEFTRQINASKPTGLKKVIVDNLVKYNWGRSFLSKLGWYRTLLNPTRDESMERILNTFPALDEWVTTKTEENEIRKSFKVVFGAEAYRAQFPELETRKPLLQQVMQKNAQNFKEFSIWEKAELLVDLKTGTSPETAEDIRAKVYNLALQEVQ